MKFEISGAKVVGIVGAVLSVGASIASSIASDKKQEEVIAKKVAEALASKDKQEGPVWGSFISAQQIINYMKGVTIYERKSNKICQWSKNNAG